MGKGRSVTRWERFGRFPAGGAVVALFGGNWLVAGTLHAREIVAGALALILLGVFVAYCIARPRGGAVLAAPVLGASVLITILDATGQPVLRVVVALVSLAATFVIASRLDERDDAIAARGRGRA